MSDLQPAAGENASPASDAGLARGFGLLRATALNMSNVVGVGPFITIPLMLAAMGGPQAVVGWAAGAVIAMCDGMVWAELGARWPGSGGSYTYLREAYGHERWGRLMAFLFIWQFIFSGPLEIGTGLIGFSRYCSYLAPGLTAMQQKLIGAGVGVVAVFALYRKIQAVGRITVALWLGTVATMVGIIVLGLPHFSAARAFTFPPGAFSLRMGFVAGLGNAMLIAMYDYMGYYDVCYIGDEVREPAKTIPRSILLCVLLVAVGYLAIETIIIGVMPWQEAMRSKYIVSEFLERLHGRPAAMVFTVMIVWTAFASVFAMLLGYSRIPYAAARDGYFFKTFARVHKTRRIPHVSLLVLGAVTIATAFFDLDIVINVLMTSRILVQFVAQIFALPLVRKRLRQQENGDSASPPATYQMWLYPVPAVIALVGWIAIFGLSAKVYIVGAVLTMVSGIAAFLVRARVTRTWPFAMG
ncbi:MAG TPA: APC family permease [Terriglobales bacterium]|nr:APC family permease [Terriglobales bacterium]